MLSDEEHVPRGVGHIRPPTDGAREVGKDDASGVVLKLYSPRKRKMRATVPRTPAVLALPDPAPEEEENLPVSPAIR